jgi:hypothetical protein
MAVFYLIFIVNIIADREAALNKVKQEFNWRLRALPQQVKELNRYVVDKSHSAVVRGVKGLLQASKDPRGAAAAAAASAKHFYSLILRRAPTEEEKQLEALLNVIHEEERKEQEVVVSVTEPLETDLERQIREYKAKQPKPVKRVDAVLVTLTMLVDPPPHFEKKLPLSRQEELKKSISKKIEALKQVTDTLSALKGVSVGSVALQNLPPAIYSTLGFAPDSQSGYQSTNGAQPHRLDSSSKKVTNTDLLKKKRLAVESIAGVGGSRFFSDDEHAEMLAKLREKMKSSRTGRGAVRAVDTSSAHQVSGAA